MRSARVAIALVSLLLPLPALAVSTGLTPEERALMREGLLPKAYPALRETQLTRSLDAARALGRQGFRGPFSLDFGNPEAMLKAARYAHANPEYARFLKGLRRGDLVFIAHEDPRYLVAMLSAGPYCHVLLCVDPEPPGKFLEATGISGTPGDPTGHRARWASATRDPNPSPSFRVTHPAEGQPEVIERAIAYAEAQLGKPYNYTFSDTLVGDRSFYCSSFVYAAFRQAGLAWTPDKSSERDRLAQALMKPLLALEPRDPMALTLACMTLVTRVPAPTRAELAGFVVREVLPACRRTAGIAPTEAEKGRLSAALTRALNGEAIALADTLGNAAALRALSVLAREAWPYADDLAALATGPRSLLTRGAMFSLDLLDAVGTGRAPRVTSADLVSPTDLAWSLARHEDYNVKPTLPLDAPWPYTVAPRRSPVRPLR